MINSSIILNVFISLIPKPLLTLTYVGAAEDGTTLGRRWRLNCAGSWDAFEPALARRSCSTVGLAETAVLRRRATGPEELSCMYRKSRNPFSPRPLGVSGAGF